MQRYWMNYRTRTRYQRTRPLNLLLLPCFDHCKCYRTVILILLIFIYANRFPSCQQRINKNLTYILSFASFIQLKTQGTLNFSNYQQRLNSSGQIIWDLLDCLIIGQLKIFIIIKNTIAVMDDQSMQVELYFSARNLKDLDVFSKSDPFLKLSMQTSMNSNIQNVGRTQTINNNVNPNWKQKITVQYFFQMKQPVVLEIYDEDSSNNAEFIGKAQTSMGQIMGSHLQTLILDINNSHGKPAGKVVVRAEKVEESSYSLNMKWRGTKIANVDSFFNFIDKSDPYLKFSKVRQDNTLIQVGRTEHMNDNQEPNWKSIVLPSSKLFDMNNPNSSFKVQCWDYEEGNKQHQFIGEFFVSAADLKNKQAPIQYALLNPKIKKAGKIILENFQMVATPNFIDYLKSGLQLNLVAAIDFTGSNGMPTSPGSLHYIAKQPTQYQMVLKSIWDIIENYDSDKKIPAFGFGAKPHFPHINSNQAVHCFPINDNPGNPEIQGFNNLMSCYVNAVTNMEFAGPTYFAPILSEAFGAAQKLANSYSYQILLILTDGQIHDMAATKDIIVKNSNLPTSIIIVGIGNASFENMEELDGDGGLFGSNGTKCPRDIVQFVPFNKYNGNPQLLAAELLRQIPKQVTQYFSYMGRLPQPVKPPSMEQIAPSNNKSMTQVLLNQHI